MDIVDKVRKLQAQAAGTGFEAERDTFLAKATELIKKHEISQEQLEPEVVREKMGITVIVLPLKYRKSAQAIFTGLLMAFDAPGGMNANKAGEAWIVGLPEVGQTLANLLNFLIIQKEAAWRQRKAEGYRTSNTWDGSYHLLYASELQRRLIAIGGREAGSALVSSAARDLFESFFAGGEVREERMEGSSEAWQTAIADGAAADLGGLGE